MTVRPARQGDLDAMVALSSGDRARRQLLEPTFWRVHADADERQRAWFELLLHDDAHRLLVSVDGAGGNAQPEPAPAAEQPVGAEQATATVDGFVIARAVDAPPVYDPGGRTCLVDDLVVPTLAVAERLMSAVRRWGDDNGCTQLVVVTAAADAERRHLLGQSGLHPTSEWWTGPIQAP
ncbi:MAG: hypothetical protein AAGD35_04530 [Actinomycetota bacterium]